MILINISIHAPRTGSDALKLRLVRAAGISIHAPRTGSDGRLGGSPHRGVDFNPRSPHGERQVKARAVNQSKDISIHAPRTGSDQRGEDRHYYIRHFNPRSPHGERPLSSSSRVVSISFQSTLPARGATPSPFAVGSLQEISIHAPRTGSD